MNTLLLAAFVVAFVAEVKGGVTTVGGLIQINGFSSTCFTGNVA
jgi:hypothetical protein